MICGANKKIPRLKAMKWKKQGWLCRRAKNYYKICQQPVVLDPRTRRSGMWQKLRNDIINSQTTGATEGRRSRWRTEKQMLKYTDTSLHEVSGWRDVRVSRRRLFTGGNASSSHCLVKKQIFTAWISLDKLVLCHTSWRYLLTVSGYHGNGRTAPDGHVLWDGWKSLGQ